MDRLCGVEDGLGGRGRVCGGRVKAVCGGGAVVAFRGGAGRYTIGPGGAVEGYKHLPLAPMPQAPEDKPRREHQADRRRLHRQ